MVSGVFVTQCTVDVVDGSDEVDVFVSGQFGQPVLDGRVAQTVAVDVVDDQIEVGLEVLVDGVQLLVECLVSLGEIENIAENTF